MIRLQSVSKRFGPKLIIDSLSFEIESGRFVSIFGPNGCGKSTLLNIVCGLESFDAGSVVGRERIRGRIGFVFQDYRQSLLPWLNGYDNIIFPLRLRRLGEREIRRRVDEIAKLVPVNFDLRQRVQTLSGGQAQTISIMRALAIRPELLILDEPFSALDYRTVMALRQNLLQVTSELKLTTIFVSHDLEEALYLGDKAVFLSAAPTHVTRELFLPWGRNRTPQLLGYTEFAAKKLEALKLVIGEDFGSGLRSVG